MGELSKKIESLVSDPIENIKRGEMSFVIYFVDDKTALLPAEHPDNMIMTFISSDKNLAEEMKTPFPGIYGFNAADKVSYQFPLTEDNVKSIMPIISTDLIGSLTYQNLELYKATGLHSYYIFIKPEEINDFVKNYKAEASKVKHLGKFCIIPYKGDIDQLKVFGFTEEDLPGLLFINNGEKFPLKKCTENNVETFINDVLEKKIEPLFVSQDEPANNDELNVKVFTRNNIEKFRADKTKDKLLVFSSPSCNYCVQFRPILEELGTIAKTHFDNKIVIGSCDITVNDISDFDISSVPKIYFIKGETNDVFQFESKTRSVQAIADFIKEKSSSGLDFSPFLKEDSKLEEAVFEKSEEKQSEVVKESRDL